MSTLSASSSRSSVYSSASQSSLKYEPPTPNSIVQIRSASSSKVSFDPEDEENDTITPSRPWSQKLEKRRSSEDIRLLAISTHMTELSYAISDIQTRIFEIQELRHKSQTLGDSADTNTTSIIDQSLMTLDERLESLEKGIKAVNETLEPILVSATNAGVPENGSNDANEALSRKHATLLADWESVQEESDVLREELKEDKWLTVFRTVTDQADGMMSSLEKAVNRCQEFIWQVHRRGMDDFQSNAAMTSGHGDKSAINLEVFNSIFDSYDAKKKHYMPATSKVLSIIDKGVKDRVTKNGETLRRHAESAQRWKNLRERIARTDTEMENTRKLLAEGDNDDHESNTSGTTSTRNGFLATPATAPRVSRVSSSGSIASNSLSPFRKFARRITGGSKSTTAEAPPTTPLTVLKKSISSEPPPTTAALRRQRASLFGTVRDNNAVTPSTPEKPIHKHSMSYTPDSSPHSSRAGDVELLSTGPTRVPLKQRWNSSTKVEQEGPAINKALPRRPPSASGHYGRLYDDVPPVPPLATPSRRSLSRMSMASSRPWSPIMSSNSTTHSSSFFHPHVPTSTLRTPSRAQTPSRAITPSLVATPRTRPKTPSHIPTPGKTLRSLSGVRPAGEWSENDGYLHSQPQSPTSPTSASGFSGSPPPPVHPPRPPSRSMIPIPSVHLHTPSRPSSSMSHIMRSESPTMRSFKAQTLRAQTPEHSLRSRAQQMPVHPGSAVKPKRLPPSSFRDGSTSRAPSRPGSRTGAFTPSMDQVPLHEYIPGNNFDPLDVEVAAVVNSIAHGLLVERVDPHLRKTQIPKEGEEIKAQYAFSNALSRKVVTCRLTTLTRAGKTGSDTITSKKVMCRVGGGWQDLSHYILNRQAGLG